MRAPIAAIALAFMPWMLSGCANTRPSDPIRIEGMRWDQNDPVLNRTIPFVDFHDTPLDTAIDTIRKQTGANIVVAWSVLESAGYDRKDFRISCQLKHVTLGQMFDAIAAQTSIPALDVENDGGIIVLTTPAAIDEKTEIRIYDVRDLLGADSKLRAADRATSNTSATQPAQTSAESLVSIITDYIRFRVWDGDQEPVSEFAGHLVVRASAPQHARIAQILAVLRK
jgi:hypothetical protein